MRRQHTQCHDGRFCLFGKPVLFALGLKIHAVKAPLVFIKIDPTSVESFQEAIDGIVVLVIVGQMKKHVQLTENIESRFFDGLAGVDEPVIGDCK